MTDYKLVADFWGKEFELMRQNSGYWINNELISSNICRLITGKPIHWLPWLFHEYFESIPRFERVLSICCGDGAHELSMMQTGKINFLHAFDISEEALASAASRFEQANISKDRYKLEVMDVNKLDISGHYDLLISAGAAHHVSNLEGLFSKAAELLNPSGYLVLLEYVGPTRFQWIDRQIEVINSILDCLDEKYLVQGQRIKLGRPAIDDIMRLDPSEAVRSEEILNIMEQYFSIEFKRDYNGTVIHQLYERLNGELGNKNNPDFDSIIRLILLVEDLFIKSGYLQSDFTFTVSRPRTGFSRYYRNIKKWLN